MNNQELIDLLEKAIKIIREDQIKKLNLEYKDYDIEKIEFKNLEKLLKSDEWPEAVPPLLICEDNEVEKMERAEGIIEYFFDDGLENKKFLDFGCGEGHVALKSSEKTSKSIGYDLVISGQLDWDSELLTTDFFNVVKNSPYDFILLYDVLDHCQDPVFVLNQIKSVMNENSKLFVRCHSWMSRHGSHLYKKLNKAWVHLFFSEEELKNMGIEFDFIQKYYFPINKHKSWFNESGFQFESSDIVRSFVEPFFRRQEILSRIPEEFNGEFPEWQMSQTFNDYVLKIK